MYLSVDSVKNDPRIKHYLRVKANTFEIEYHNKRQAIRLYDTDIVTWDKDSNVMLNTGGWGTHTTIDRINKYMNASFRLFTQKFELKLETPYGIFDFFDGMCFDCWGKPVKGLRFICNKKARKLMEELKNK